jgi:hypothetical protein
MARQRFDIASKYLLHNQGKGVLPIGGIKNVRRIEPMPGEIVQTRKYPDGLLQVFLGNERKPHHVLVEVAIYSEKRALKQALNDLTLAYSVLGHLPDLLMLILRPKGTVRITGKHEVRGKLEPSRLTAEWKPVEMWTQPARQFLEKGDVGAVPWATLMDFDGPPEELLQLCAAKIEREAHPKDQADLLAVSQVLTELRFPNPELLQLLGGEKLVIESPMLQRMVAKSLHVAIQEALKARFGSVPRDVTRLLGDILDERKLHKLNGVAAKCMNLDAFRETLLE